MAAAASSALSATPGCAAMIDFDAAQAMLRQNAAPLGTQIVPLSKAGRRILAAPVVARIDSPRRDCAAMDGYAVRSKDLAAKGIGLRLCGESAAGGACPPPLAVGTTVAVSTGAPMPPGADRVVMWEQAERKGDTIIMASAGGKAHVRRRASDFAVGDHLLAPGCRLDPRMLVVAAAANVDAVSVWRRPRLRLLSCGDELVAPGTADDLRQLPDSLGEALMLMARQFGAAPAGRAHVPDHIATMTMAARAALDDADILLVTGGASHGCRDFARAALVPLGLRLLFAGVAMKPGKPLWYGRIGKAHVLGLPGNPAAAMTVARLFLAPLVSAMAGAGFDDALRWFELPSDQMLEAGSDRDQYLCGRRAAGAAQILARQQASAQMLLAQAELLVERRAHASAAQAGTPLRCLGF